MSSTNPEQKQQQQNEPKTVTEVEMATALMSISGPCRSVGDVYLACVATAGLGMCRHLRKNVVDCVQGTSDVSTQMLEGFAQQVCDPNSSQEEQMLCAARFVNQQMMMGPTMEASTSTTSPSSQEGP